MRSIILIVLALLTFTIVPLLSSGRALGKESKINPSKLLLEGKKLYEIGKFEAAAIVWQEAADVYEQLGDDEKKTQSLINVAEALQAHGLYLKACDRVLQAFNFEHYNCRQIIQENESPRSQQLLIQQIQALINSTNPLTIANGLRSLGDLLQKLGHPELSAKVLPIALQAARQLPFSEIESATLLSLGNTQKILGERIQIEQTKSAQLKKMPINCDVQTNVPSAVKFYQQADYFYQQAATKSISSHTWIQAQLNRLSLSLKTNTISLSPKLLSQIYLQLKDLPKTQTTIYTQINFAKSLTCLKQNSVIATPSWTEITNLLIGAIKQAKNIDNGRTESYALGYLGWLYQQQQNTSEAIFFTQKALFLAQSINAGDILHQWQWQLGYMLETQGDISGAIAAYSEAVNILQSLRRDLIGINSQIQFSFQDKVEPVYHELVRLYLQAVTNLDSAQDNLQKARNIIESFQLVELENFLRELCLESKVELDRIVDRDDSLAAVIYPIILEKQLAIILKLPRQQKLYYYAIDVNQNRLENTIVELHQYLPDVTRMSQVKQLSQQLYNWLILPLETELNNSKIETLVFVLSNSLRNIPMAVLYDPQAQKYLIEKYAISLAPSLQLVPSPSVSQFKIKVLAAGISQQHQVAGLKFPPLNNVKQELNLIKSQISDSEELLDTEFTKMNLQKKLKYNSFSVLHLATHSRFSSNFQDNFILAWDRLLKIEDLVDLLQLDSTRSNLNPIELLILSSCETAKGDREAGLGMAGIAVRSGARSTLATLWSIDDFSTAEIMNQLYQELNKGISRAKALQKAQLAFLKKEERPFFWAPFVLIGNWL